jgi:hypothetical protein
MRLKAPKSRASSSQQVVLQTSSSVAPASASTVFRFSITWRVCASMPPATISPCALAGTWPDT